MSYTLRALAGRYAVVRLPAGVLPPRWSMQGTFWQVLHTPDECTILCGEQHVPADVSCEAGWYVLKVQGPLRFEQTGVLHALLSPLAAKRIPVLSVSAYSTDYVLVRDLGGASAALREAGHEVC